MKLLIWIFVSIFLSQCNHQNSETSVPKIFKPNWDDIDISNQPIKFGQVVQFQLQSDSFKAVLLDYDQDENGIWLGFCFLSENNLFARRIPSGQINDCIRLYDLSYLNQVGLKSFKIIDQILIDTNEVGIGSISPCMDIDEFHNQYLLGIALREKEETPCEKKIPIKNPINECFIELKSIKNSG